MRHPGNMLLEAIFTKNSRGSLCIKRPQGQEAEQGIFQYASDDAFVLLLTGSQTLRSPWPRGHCLTFKHHKSLVFLISIACGNSDFYQLVFKLPCIGAIVHRPQSRRESVLWEHHNEETCSIQRNLMIYQDLSKGRDKPRIAGRDVIPAARKLWV